jgi:peptide chain release factor 1
MVGAILEFRGACGGQESFLFASEMKEIFQSFLQSKGFSCSTTSDENKTIILKASGNDVYNYIRHEAGVHKVIRVPETEARGRLHSSTMILMILPEVPFNYDLDEKELKIEYTRAQGPGGQHVNKTESACRIVHEPSGVTVSIQEYRNQHQNKAKALEIIKEKVFQYEFNKKKMKDAEKRKNLNFTGDRSEKIRTYNFQQDRITDHRLNKTVYGMKKYLNQGVMFEECIEEIADIEYEARKNDFIEQFKELGK